MSEEQCPTCGYMRSEQATCRCGLLKAQSSFAAPPLLGGFVVTEETYPSGKKYLLVKRGKERIGNCEQVADGFLVWGKRKPVATLLLAVKQMLDDGMNRARAEQSRWQKLMGCLKTECGPIPPNDQIRRVAD